MLFGLLLAGLIGLAVAGVVFLVCKVFSYYRKNGTLKHRSFPSSLRKVECSLLLRWRESFFRWMESRIRYFRRRFWGKGCAIEPDKGEIYAPADGVILKLPKQSCRQSAV